MSHHRNGIDTGHQMESWFGELSKPWKKARFKHLCKLITDGSHHSPPSQEEGKPYITVRDLKNGGIDFNAAAKISDEDFKKLIQSGCAPQKGDVLFSKDGSIGKVALVESSNFVVLSSLAILRPKASLKGTFLKYLVESSPIAGQIESFYAGAALKRITLDQIVEIWGLQPNEEEQTSIVSFLDRETARIDALIEKKQRLIELLQEKRQAIITRAVTKGLDPNVSMKDSGVEWLGEVPEHWEVKKIKFTAIFSGGGTPDKENLDYWDGQIPWVSPKDMKKEQIEDSEDHITTLGLAESATSLIEPGAVLMVVRSGILRHSIPIAINITQVALNQDMKAIRFLSGKVLPKFFLRWIQGQVKQLLFLWRKQGATVESIEQEYFLNTKIALPSPFEQQEVVTHLDRELERIDGIISKSQSSIDLLQERRSALITAAVTGQIDVRGEVA